MLCKLFTFLVQHLLRILASSKKMFPIDFWPKNIIDFSYLEFDAYICFSLFPLSGSFFNSVITWSHLASVVTVEWKQLSHKTVSSSCIFHFPVSIFWFSGGSFNSCIACSQTEGPFMKEEEKKYKLERENNIEASICRNNKIDLRLLNICIPIGTQPHVRLCQKYKSKNIFGINTYCL